MNGAEAFLETLRRAGVRYVFGIPGTTEVPLIDVMAARADIQFVLSLHESIAAGMADGWARATGKPGVVSVHTTVGTANTLGMVINSFSDDVPVLVTAGIKDQRALGTGVFCDSPYQVTDLLRQYTKWSWQVLDPSCLGRDLAKGIRMCQSPSAGPVFIGIPENFWMAASEAGSGMEKDIRYLYGGDLTSIDRAVRLLQGAVRPILMVGNEVGRAGALAEATALAELWQMPVFSEERNSWTNLNFPTDHPLYIGNFNHNSALVSQADVVLSMGARMFMPMGYQTNSYFSSETQIIQVHSDSSRISSHIRAAVEIISDARSALQDFLAASRNLEIKHEERKEQLEEIVRFKSAKAQAQQELLQGAESSKRIKVQHLISELSRLAAEDAVVINEGVRSGFYLQDYFDFTRQRAYFGYTGGCLGWGMGAAMGIKLACPERQVIAFLGDGSFLFSPQALWTAAHYNIAVKTVICNNMAYMAVKGSLLQLRGQAATSLRFVGVDLTEPAIDYPSLCQGFGVPAWKVSNPGELPDTIRQFLAHEGPAVLEVVLDPGDMVKRPE